MLLVSCLVSLELAFLHPLEKTNNSFQYCHLLTHVYTRWCNWRSKNQIAVNSSYKKQAK